MPRLQRIYADFCYEQTGSFKKRGFHAIILSSNITMT